MKIMDINSGSSFFDIYINEKDGFRGEMLPCWDKRIRVAYFKRGGANVNINLKEYKVQNESFCIINKGDIFSIENCMGRSLEYILSFDPSYLQFEKNDLMIYDFLDGIIKGDYIFRNFIDISNLGYIPLFNCVSRIFNYMRAVNNIDKDDPEPGMYLPDTLDTALIMKAGLYKLISALNLAGAVIKRPEDDDCDRVYAIKDAVNYIRDHYMEKIYVSDLSDLVGLNEQYFIRFFGSVMKQPPIDYINEYRVNKSIELLGDTDKLVREIATECGFNTSGNYIRVFRSFKNETPLQYRKKIRSVD